MKKRLYIVCALLLGAAAFSFNGCSQETAGAYEQAMAALEDGNLQQAEGLFQTAEESDDRQAEVARGRGILSLAQGEYEEAMEYFDAAIAYAGKKQKLFVEDVQLYRAETCLSRGDEEGAEEICLELLEGTMSGKAELLLGKIALDRGEFEEASEHFTAAAEAEQSFDTYLTIYDLYVNVSMEAYGAAYLEQALLLSPADAADYCSQGQVYYNLGDTEQAKSSFARAIDLGNADAVPMLGNLYLENGEIQAARTMYQTYLDEAGRPAIAYNGLALCDLADQDYDAALSNISKGLEEEDADVRESLLLNEIAAYEYKLDFQTAKTKMAAFLEEYPENEKAVRENIFLQSR